MGVETRIKRLIEHYEYNVSSFSKAIGLTGNVTIHKIVKGESAPSFATLLKIKEAFPEINTDWILNGDGDMIIKNQKDISWYKDQLENAKEEIKWHRDLVDTLKTAINNQTKKVGKKRKPKQSKTKVS